MLRTHLVQDVVRKLVQELDLIHLRKPSEKPLRKRIGKNIQRLYVKLQIRGHRGEENVRKVQVK